MLKSGLGRITENTSQYQGVVVYSMADIPLVSRDGSCYRTQVLLFKKGMFSIGVLERINSQHVLNPRKTRTVLFPSLLFPALNMGILNDFSELVSLLLNPRVLGWQPNLHKTAEK